MSDSSRVVEYESPVTVTENGKEPIIEFIGTTDEYVPSEDLADLNQYSPNQPVLYRHNHPLKGKDGEVVGRVLDSHIGDVLGSDKKMHKGIIGHAKLMNKTHFQKDIVNYVRAKEQAKDPIKVSIGYVSTSNEEGKIVDRQILEYSLTYKPVCKECGTKMGDKEELKMHELEVALESSTSKVTEYESKISELESQLVEKDEEISASKTKVTEMETRIGAIEAKAIRAEKKPYIDKLVEMEKDDDLVSFYESLNVKQLQDRCDKIAKRMPNPIVTQTLNEARDAALKGETADEWKKKAIASGAKPEDVNSWMNAMGMN